MNKIEELIEQLCPDGVEFQELGKVASFRRGSFPQPYGELGWYDGENAMPFVQVADVSKNMRLVENTKQKISKLAQPKSVFVPAETVIVTLQGSIGRVAITQYDSYVDRTLAIFENFKIEIDKKYFAFQLERKFGFEKENARGSTIKTITKEEFTKFLIPIPPLPIQQEIANILDKFMQFEAELQAELQARRVQYEYYRNELLNFEGKEVEWKILGEVTLKTENIKWRENINADFQYIDLSSVCRENNKISDTQTINSKTAPSRAQQIVNKDDVIFGTTRPTLKRYSLITSKYHNQICSTGFCVLRANKEVLLPKFMFFILTTADFYNYVENNQEGAGYPSISNSIVKKFLIPIPPMEEQERIIGILDRFDTLVNDISVGLPAEIQARRKQYEYYRGKLLEFKPVVSDKRLVVNENQLTTNHSPLTTNH